MRHVALLITLEPFPSPSNELVKSSCFHPEVRGFCLYPRTSIVCKTSTCSRGLRVGTCRIPFSFSFDPSHYFVRRQQPKKYWRETCVVTTSSGAATTTTIIERQFSAHNSQDYFLFYTTTTTTTCAMSDPSPSSNNLVTKLPSFPADTTVHVSQSLAAFTPSHLVGDCWWHVCC